MRRIIFILTIIMSALFLANTAFAQKCRPDPNGPQKVPCANEIIDITGGEYKKVSGVVQDENGGGLEQVKLALYRIDGDQKTFVGAAEAGEKGKFCFTGLPGGKYVLHVGQGDKPFSGFKCVEFTFTFAPNKEWASQSKIKIRLPVGT